MLNFPHCLDFLGLRAILLATCGRVPRQTHGYFKRRCVAGLARLSIDVVEPLFFLVPLRLPPLSLVLHLLVPPPSLGPILQLLLLLLLDIVQLGNRRACTIVSAQRGTFAPETNKAGREELGHLKVMRLTWNVVKR